MTDGFAVAVNGSQVWAAGELDLASAGELSDALTQAGQSAAGQVTADLSDLTFCDCAGLRVLLDAQQALRSGGVRLVVHPSPALHRLLAVTDLTGELDLLL